jgi:hypothetical protein
MAKRFESENFTPDIQAKADQMNLEESLVPQYTLPVLPINNNTTPEEFLSSIRPNLVKLMEEHLYGVIPPKPNNLEYKVKNIGIAFDNLAERREYDIICQHNGEEQILHMLLYLPIKDGKVLTNVSLFFGLNFNGNHVTSNDNDVTFYPFTPFETVNNSPRFTDPRKDESFRNFQNKRWCFEKLLANNYAVATISYSDLYVDHPYGFDTSIMRFFYTKEEWNSPNCNSSIISAWAWGIERAIDVLEQIPEINKEKIAVIGHSRLGKTALWAGANDTRIKFVISNCSGTGGAKLSHRYYGEDFSWIYLWHPRWMRPSFIRYVNNDLNIPVDQHFLMAAIAPRMLYVASANEDYYADPKGEFLSLKHAEIAWNIFGITALGDEEYPPCGKLIGNKNGYYLRKGIHKINEENWDILLEFAKNNNF